MSKTVSRADWDRLVDKAIVFPVENNLKKANLPYGSLVILKGKDLVNDGGGDIYIIRSRRSSDVFPSSKDILLDNGDVAEKLELALAGEISLYNAVLTGTPTAPTPTHGDDSKKVATTEFVQDALDGATPVPIPDSEIEEYWEDLDPAEREQYLPLTGGTLTGVVNGVTPPLNDYSTKLATTKYVKDYADSCVPTGCVQAFAGNTTPQGWLLCDGSAVSRTQYSRLFGVIGTTYGAGDGTDTFNLPNLVDKFVEGSATAGTVIPAGIPNIVGSHYNTPVYSPNGAFVESTQSSAGMFANGAYYKGTTIHFNAANGETHNGTLSNLVYGKSDTVQPPSVTMRYIIKA